MWEERVRERETERETETERDRERERGRLMPQIGKCHKLGNPNKLGAL